MTFPFTIAIAHAAYRADRRASLATLLLDLTCAGLEAKVFASAQREKSMTWAPPIWAWASQQGCPVAILNDDVRLVPRFGDVLAAMLAAVPGEILSLHAQGPEVSKMADRGHRWVRMCSYTGPGVVLPVGIPAALLKARGGHGAISSQQNDDVFASTWMQKYGKPAYLPLPAIVHHRVDLPSTFPTHDAAPHRQSSVDWKQFRFSRLDLASAKTWTLKDGKLPPWIGNPGKASLSAPGLKPQGNPYRRHF